MFLTKLSIGQISINDPDVIQIIHTDRLEVEGAIKRLTGDIQMKQKDTYFFCDKAVIEEDDVYASGNVRIEQGDSIQITSSTLDYYKEQDKAVLKGDVKLIQDNITLTTPQFDYNLATNIGYYTRGGVIKDSVATLKSRSGTYDGNRKMALFKDDVKVTSEDFELDADSLEHDLENQISYFRGSTNFLSGVSKGYTEKGFFNHNTRYTELFKNSTFQDTLRNAEADTIKYNGENDFIELIGNAHYYDKDSFEVISDYMTYDKKQDFYTLKGKSFVKKNNQTIQSENANYDATTEKIIFWDDVELNDKSMYLYADTVSYDQLSEYALATSNVKVVDTSYQGHIYSQKLEYFKPLEKAIASENPYVIQYLESDSLILDADTLLTFVDSTLVDSATVAYQKVISCYNDVRIYKSDFQGLADSLTYHTSDSLITMYSDPIAWADSTQFSSDTIRTLLKGGNVDNVLLDKNAFVINTSDFLLFNQIKGKEVKALMKEGALDRVLVNGNGESLYFIKDEEGGYVAMNKTVCGNMSILFNSSELEEIVFYAQPEATLFPINTNVSSPENFLKGYNWEVTKRPLEFDALKK